MIIWKGVATYQTICEITLKLHIFPMLAPIALLLATVLSSSYVMEHLFRTL